jgi:hypothetical protein
VKWEKQIYDSPARLTGIFELIGEMCDTFLFLQHFSLVSSIKVVFELADAKGRNHWEFQLAARQLPNHTLFYPADGVTSKGLEI